MTVTELDSALLWTTADSRVDNEFASGEHTDAYFQEFYWKSDGTKRACRVFVNEEFAYELARGFGWTLVEDALPLSQVRVLIAYGNAAQIKLQLLASKEHGKIQFPA